MAGQRDREVTAIFSVTLATVRGTWPWVSATDFSQSLNVPTERPGRPPAVLAA